MRIATMLLVHRMSLNPAHLRAFLAVQRHANYTRAAAELFLTQPAVSRQIDQLEKQLGVTLFEQIGKTTHLTPAGQTLQREAERLLGDMERVAETVRALGSPQFGRIAVGASSTPGLYLLPRIIGEFCRRFPDVEFHYRVEDSRRIEERILNNEMDIAFVGVAPTDRSLIAQRVLEDRVVFFASPKHPLAYQRDIDAKELAASCWIVRERGAATRQFVESSLPAATIEPRREIEINSPEGVKALVAAGVGISYMSIHGLADDFAHGRLKQLNVRALDLRRSIYQVRHRDKHVSNTMSEFMKLAASSVATVAAQAGALAKTQAKSRRR
jgi:DNA-binding transcriptional LysR family regulator